MPVQSNQHPVDGRPCPGSALLRQTDVWLLLDAAKVMPTVPRWREAEVPNSSHVTVCTCLAVPTCRLVPSSAE
ncbi:hypothetical protein XELAEV_18046659mg [Xenopus laevis]|uniref:Uncharacterized protein n=1 Tax=Xenopus laevis TaxID=8355 RepID=A0A974H0S2_XENLA|nr:hypothetical protein XELAEV_18046659mg [Xenopus laevis]